MIRPFHLRDLPLVIRLGEQGVILEAEAALTSSPHPVRSALVNMIVGGEYATYVWRSDKGRDQAFVQIGWAQGSNSARLACLGASPLGENDEDDPQINEDIWLALLDELVALAGKHGAYNLIAEASETGPELPVLRKACFAIYTRQDIWITDRTPEGDIPVELRPRQSADDWDVQVLYSNIVPGLIQSVEPTPSLDRGQNWVLYEKGELAAFIHMNVGHSATWMRLLIHPNARSKPREIIKAAARIVSPSSNNTLYCSIRRYQSWLQDPLEQAGFTMWGSQAVMIRHIAQPVEKRVPAVKGVLDAQPVPGSSTLVQGFSQTNGDGYRNR
jgi:hypothetical protein